MKYRVLAPLILTTIITLASCGRSGNSASEQLDTATTNNSFKNTDEGVGEGVRKTEGDKGEAAGAALIANNDCQTCHQENDKLIGPSYKDIANKYTTGDIDLLAKKVIEGGAGVWGEVPMTPHPQVSEEDAKAMVTYILSMK